MTAGLVSVWRRAQLADRLYLVWFASLGVLVAWQRVDGWPLLVALHAAAIVAIALLVRAADRVPAAHAWYPWALPLVTFPEVARLNLVFVDGWQDAGLLAFEGWLFPEPPTVWLPRVTPPLLAEIFRAGYLSYFALLLTVAGLFWRRRQEAAFRGVMAASVLAYLACYVVFLAWPTEGPAHTLRHAAVPIAGGPLRDLVVFVQQAGVHGNAFPSAHVAGALPTLVYARRFAPRLTAPLAALIVLMGFGAVHDGYHYASDVVAGAAVGAVAAWVLLAAQQAPVWARRIGLPAVPQVRTAARS